MSAETRKAQRRPVELVLLCAGLAVFVGLVVMLGTREIVLATIFAVIAFIVALVSAAMFALVESKDRQRDD